MKDSFTETGMKNICDREPRVVERCLVCIERNAPRVLNDNGLGNRVGYPPKLPLLGSPLLFRLFEILDIGIRPVPIHDRACHVPQWLILEQEPSILPIETPQAALDVS